MPHETQESSTNAFHVRGITLEHQKLARSNSSHHYLEKDGKAKRTNLIAHCNISSRRTTSEICCSWRTLFPDFDEYNISFYKLYTLFRFQSIE